MIHLGMGLGARDSGLGSTLGLCYLSRCAPVGGLVTRASRVPNPESRVPGDYPLSLTMPFSTQATLAGRSPRRRMKYGNHCFPKGTYTRIR